MKNKHFKLVNKFPIGDEIYCLYMNTRIGKEGASFSLYQGDEKNGKNIQHQMGALGVFNVLQGLLEKLK